MPEINYNNRRFALKTTDTGDTAAINGTLFVYTQQGDVVTCDYAGGSMKVGRMIDLVNADSSLTIRFEHIYNDGRMMSGKGNSRLELLPDGRLRLHETYTAFDASEQGRSVVEELPAD